MNRHMTLELVIPYQELTSYVYSADHTTLIITFSDDIPELCLRRTHEERYAGRQLGRSQACYLLSACKQLLR